MSVLFDTEKLKELLKAFYTLTGVRIVVYDAEYRQIASYPGSDCSFCCRVRDMAECEASNRAAFTYCAEHPDLYTYRCRSGLIESMIRLQTENRIVGYIMFGQVSDIPDADARVRSLQKKFSECDLEEEIRALPYKSREEIDSASVILLALARYTVSESIVRIGKERFLQKLDELIDANMENPELDVGWIARKFNVCKTTLYDTAKQYLSTGIARYITLRRIRRAKQLLKDPELPVSKICYYVGFTDYNYFSRVFKKEEGMTCTEYRKMFGKTEENP